MAFTLNQADLEFVLKQIKIAEANANGIPLTNILLDAQGEVITDPNASLNGQRYYALGTFEPLDPLQPRAVPDAQTPFGLRTVDGTYNNLVPGQETWGAAGQPMPRLFDDFGYVNDTDGDTISFGGGMTASQGNYTPGTPAGPLLADGSVVDADPRTISNLIADMSLNNPAAIVAALSFAGSEAIYGNGGALQAIMASASGAWQPLIDILNSPVASPEQKEASVTALNAALDIYGLSVDQTGSLVIPNVAPDEGLSAPFNSWMTFFGQFFDHGLDLISKGGAGTIYVPLQPDDPLYQANSPTNFMVVTRSTTFTNEDGQETQRNVTTPWVDQNQTYTSHASHQVFLREYKVVDGKPVATGKLLDGKVNEQKNGLPTWADIKAQALMLGIELTDRDVGSVPLLRTDAYGNFIPDANGYAQVIVGLGPDGIPNTLDDKTVSGTPSAPINTFALATVDNITYSGALRTANAFLDDIAHAAQQVNSRGQALTSDLDDVVGITTVSNIHYVAPADRHSGNPLWNPAETYKLATQAQVVVNPAFDQSIAESATNSRYLSASSFFDDELLDRHFITGDGRGNENIGLTAVHHVFHSEHNRQVDAHKLTVLRSGDVDFINEWLVTDIGGLPANFASMSALDQLAYAEGLNWDGERLFQSGRFATEMQYQHLVFEEFGRKIQPAIDPFVFNSVTDINPAIFAEFANVIYRFGHSMLTDTMPRIFLDANGNISGTDDMGLITSFLNPLAFNTNQAGQTITAEQAAGAIVRGMTIERGNEIDEFVTGALRNSLLGLPLDLAAINIARGRDTGMPTLNEARQQLFAATGSSFLTPYTSWVEFAANLKNPMSVVNFIAAYGTHESITGSVAEKRDAALALVLGTGGTQTDTATVTNASFENDSLAGGPGVIVNPLGNYTLTAPSGWTLTGTGGLIDPAAGTIAPAGINGSTVAWLGQNAVLSQTTQVELEVGVNYRLTVDIGDRTDMPWPGGDARLVAEDGTVLGTAVLGAPPEGGWTTVSFETGAIAATFDGDQLRIEIRQTGGSTNQLFVDNVRLDALRPTAVPADRLDFLNGTGAWDTAETGLNLIDLWIGGLAEKKMPFGGFLGSTFNAVFEAQMEALQDGDRFYYLTRTQGQNFLTELEQNSFAKMIMANTDISQPGADGIRGTDDDVVTRHIGVDSFATYDYVLEVNAANQADYFGIDDDAAAADNDPLTVADGKDPVGNDPVLEALGLGKVIRNDPGTPGADSNYLRTFGGEHVVVGGTSGNDTIITDFGDDGIWGDAGNDRIESGAGVDLVNGGAGDDIITDSGDTGDFLKGDAGNDVIANSNGLDILMGGTGNDVVFVGVDDTEVFGGEGDDFIAGGDGVDMLIGGEGDDWLEGGGGFDTTAGDNSELFFNSTIIGHDVMFAGSEEHDFDAESGDDIMVQGPSVMRSEGMFGYDWAIHKGNTEDGDSDLTKPIFTTDAADILRDRFDAVEALSGWERNDVLRGDDRGVDPLGGGVGPVLAGAEGTMVNHELTQAGVNRIDGLRELLGARVAAASTTPGVDLESIVAFNAGNILLGGGGSDIIEGRGGNDIIDGDAWLNVRISIRVDDPESESGTSPLATVDSLRHIFSATDLDPDAPAGSVIPAAWIGKSLSELMIARTIAPLQLNIVREIVVDDGAGDKDVAVFNDSYLGADGTPNYVITPNADGTFTVTHETVTVGVDPETGRQIVSDGVDTVRNVELLQFADRAISLVKPVLELNGFDPFTRNWGDNFNTIAYTNNNAGTTDTFNGPWVEEFDGGGATGGSVQITTGGSLTFSHSNLSNAAVTRAFNLEGASSARVTFSVNDANVSGFLDDEEMLFEFAAGGSNFIPLRTFDGDNSTGVSVDLPTDVPFSANAAIRFRMINSLDERNLLNQLAPETFSVDNLTINAIFLEPATPPSVNIATSYVEDAPAVSIASDPRITDFGTTLASARIVLTNAFPGDTLVIPAALTVPGALIAAVTQVVGSTIVVTLTGTASLAAYQTAIQSIGFRAISQAPDTTPRIIETTVNGGFFESDPAITTINVQSVDDPVDAVNDTIITNALPGIAIDVPEWALLANDTDPDNTIDITAVGSLVGLTAALGANAITLTDTGGPNGTLQYTAIGGAATDTAQVTLNTVANTTTLTENFDSNSYTQSDGAWQDNWSEAGDDNSSTNDNGQIRIIGSRLEFDNGSTPGNSNGASILRELSGLAGAPSATISYNVTEALDANEAVTVEFSRDGTSIQQVQLINSATGNNGVSGFVLAGPFTADAFIRFTVSSLNDADDLVSIDNISVSFPTTISGGNNAEILIGDVNGSTFVANGGDDIIIGGLGNDAIDGGAGNDTIVWSANVSGATDGSDFMNGGANTDTVIVKGNGDNEAFVVYSRTAALANGIAGLNAATEIVITRNGALVAELDNVEEIVIETGEGTDSVTTLGTFNGTSLSFSTITIDGGSGDDTVDISGLLSAHRIVFRSNGGNDTIVGNLRPQDVIELVPGADISTYALVDNGNGTQTFSNGAHSITFTGAVPPEFVEGSQPGGNSGGGAFALTASDLAGLKAIVAGGPTGDGEFEAVLGVRELSGYGNNEADPTRGAADVPFIRLTEARYGEYDASIGNNKINPIFDGLDARAISNILGTQEADLPKAANESNIFFMAFGQYFDHGLDFLPKSASNGIIQIGGPGSGRAPGTDNPADLTRGAVHEIVDGVPQHLNLTSPYVDQNQAYGSNALVGQFLRETDGQGGVGAKLFSGAPDPSSPGFNLLPTLRELIEHHWANDTAFTGMPGGPTTFRTYFAGLVNENGVINQAMVPGLASNFMGSGHALLLDSNPYINLLDHFVAGDGRANENISLTAIHTVWARNHNFHVENLLNSGFEGTPEEVFQAAKVINEAEYARVVFTEFADKLLGGIQGNGSHGFEAYNPDATAGISHEFAAAVYRFGHSLISDTLTVIDADGQPRQVALYDAFLNPTNADAAFTLPVAQLNQFGYYPQPGFAQVGVSGVVAGTIGQQAEEADFNIVDAVRSDLVRINADLFAFNVARGRDVGLGTLNQVRADLQASTDPYIREALSYAGNLDPYASWEDFQQRNGLSDAIIAQFKQAYPDLVLAAEDIAAFQEINPDIALVNGNTVKGIDRVDLWVGGLAEKHIMDGMVGQTFWIVLHEQFDRLQEADRFYYIDRLDNFDFYENIIDGQSFAEIIARNTGLTNLPERVFEISDEDDGAGVGTGDNEDDEDGDGVGAGNGDDDDDDDTTGETGGEDDEDEDDDSDGEDGEDCGCDGDGDGEGTGTPVPPPATGTGGLRTGTLLADVLVGTALADNIVAQAGDDVLIGEGGDDVLSAGEGNDFADAGEGRDVIFAGAGDDQVFAGGGNDMVYGEAGADRLFGGAGDDLIDAGAGDDTVVAGAGDDLIVGAKNDGDDVYFGDEMDGGTGVDTLDLSAITANLTVDLGNGLGGRGSASSSQSGMDTLWGVENVATGSGADTITASVAVNVMEGGAGADSFRFLSKEAADGDTILDFEPGDRLDLSGIDANAGAAGNQSFTLLASGQGFSTAAQLSVTYETRADGDYTVVSGNVEGATDAEFQINLKGSHALTGANFTL